VVTKLYRKCACGETAHDLRYELLGAGLGRFMFACRNCGNPARDRNGNVRVQVPSYAVKS
jgi:hypothetical protein